MPAFIGMLCVLHLIGMTAMLPLDDQYRSRKSFFHTVADIAHEQPVYAYHYGGYDAPFYLQRIVPFLESPETLQATLNRPERCFVIIPEQAYVEHPAHGMVTVLDQTWIAPAGFHGRQRLLLVSNQ
ncbi:MAG: hypothetical protein HYZ73_01820 [Elusimicrobia bacterium]|nr:hypothetical protein [Elusimicrobiota bacterium]